MSVVHVYNTREGKRELWKVLVHHSSSYLKPWIVLGDLNLVLKVDDRLGGNPVTWSEVVDFEDCIDTYGW